MFAQPKGKATEWIDQLTIQLYAAAPYKRINISHMRGDRMHLILVSTLFKSFCQTVVYAIFIFHNSRAKLKDQGITMTNNLMTNVDGISINMMCIKHDKNYNLQSLSV